MYSSTLPRQFLSIQALRGISCLLIVVFHSTMQMDLYYHQLFLGGWFTQGYCGVDLFFVISGFVIVHSSVKLWDDQSAFFTYWHKRITRVYPMYWLILLPVAMGTAFTSSSYEAPSASLFPVVTCWISTMLLLPNHRAINGVSWILTHEIYFYLLFSLLLLSVRLWFIPVGIGLSTLAYACQKSPGADWHSATDFFLSPFNLEFGLGVLVWFMLRRYSLPDQLSYLMLCVAARVLLTYQSTVTNEDYARRTLVFGCSSFLLLLALTSLDRINQLQVPKWLIRLGDSSYVLYLLHFPLLILANKLILAFPQTLVPIAVLNAALIVLVVVLNVYIHLQIEKPLLTILSRPSPLNT